MRTSLQARGQRQRSRQALTSFLFLLPALAFMIFSVYLPFGWNTVLSFEKWNGFSAPQWNGIQNYQWAFQNAETMHSLWNSVFFAVFSTLGAVVLGLFLAALMYKIPTKEGGFYRLIIFLPVMLPAAVVGLLFTFVFNPEMGILNNLLRAVGLSNWTHVWLEDKSTLKWCIVIVNIWKMAGLTMMLSYAAMQMLPSSIFESSKIEGASYWVQFTQIILPLIQPTVLMAAVYTLVVNFKSYDIVSVLTGGGPGTASETIPIQMVKVAFGFSKFGNAAAMGMILAIVVMAIVSALKFVFRGESYEY